MKNFKSLLTSSVLILSTTLSNQSLAIESKYSWNDAGSVPVEPVRSNYSDDIWYQLDYNTYLMDLSIYESINGEIKNEPRQSVKQVKKVKRSSEGYFRKLSESEYECLSLNVYHEARGESVKGQEAIVYTVLNRSLSENYSYGKSNHMCDILKNSYAFSWLNNGFKGAKNITKYKEIQKLVKRVVNTYSKDNSPISDATHYYAHKVVTPSWSKSNKMKKLVVVGNHTFMKHRNEKVAMK